MKFFPFTIILILFTAFGLSGQSSSILHEIEKLQNSTRVLYIAAHPDDENTKMISWLVNDMQFPTAYLSLTRGDGGQNLIGTELGAELGVLRTQELMQARKIDGGMQYFSRAVDFGYSKSAGETLEKWGKENVLSDVVWVIRNFRPDVIITRFPPDGRGGHGHHTASALLAIEAFDLAADESAYPEQLKELSPWQTRRIYWNASKWWNPKLDSIAAADPDFLSVEVGGYNPLLGYSSNELASLSRTQHKSQGFGVSVSRGGEMEYLQFLKGDKAKVDLFEGISSNWARFGFAKGDLMLQKIVEDFDVANPEKSVPALLVLKGEAAAINDDIKRRQFTDHIDKIVAEALAIHVEAMVDKDYATPGEELLMKLEVLSRNNLNNTANLLLTKVIKDGEILWNASAALQNNKKLEFELPVSLTKSFTSPYWLQSNYENLFDVKDQNMIGKAENDPSNGIELTFAVDGKSFTYKVPLIHKYSDRVEGEIIHTLNVVPPVTLSANQENMIFTGTQKQELLLDVYFLKAGQAEIELNAENWNFSPKSFKLRSDENEKHVFQKITITPGKNAAPAKLDIRLNGATAQRLVEIDYNHIERRIVLQKVQPSLVKINLQTKGVAVGYIPGAGDKVAEAVSRMGYRVDILDEDKLKNTDLSQYQAIIAGIRAYNTESWLPDMKPLLEEYMKNGGNYIVQYNTSSRDLLTMDIGPYPFEISRERVTEEDSEVKFLLPENTLLNKPNKITDEDFENWVQERGLYFAGKWDEKYLTPLGWNDEGEPQRKGGLLIADYGKGAFIYTGISFFRELPAGVPGAFRLMANLISYEQKGGNEQ